MKKLEKSLYRLAIPIFFELLFIMLLGMIDTIMLASYSDNAVGAVSNANTIINFLTVLINICSIGIGVVISNYLGAKNEEFAKKSIKTGIVFNGILGLILFLIFQLFGSSLFKLVGTSNTFLLDSTNYLKIVTISLPLIAISQILSQTLRSYGKPKPMMVVSIISNILNIVINFILINDIFNSNIPSITGVNGAAIGTLASHIFRFIMSIILVKKIVGIKLFPLETDKTCIKQIIKIGLPSALENTAYNITQFIILWVINQMIDENIVIARAYVLTIVSFVYQFSCAFANANQIIVGYSIGEENYDYAYKHTYKSFFHSLIYVFIMITLINILRYPILRLLTSNEDIIKMALSVLPLFYIWEFGRASNLVFIQALKASGDTIFPLIIAIISMFGFAALGSYIFGISLNMGLTGVILGSALDELVRGIIVIFRWKSKVWTNKSILKNNELINE